MPSGKVGHHPGWEPLQGSASDHVPGLLQARAGSPDPFRGMVRSSARILTGGARDSSPLPSARKGGQGKPFPSQMCAGQSSVRGNPMCGQDVRGSSYRARRSAKHSSPQQQHQLVASAARLRDPIICAGPDMSDTERNVSRTRLSAFDWTSTIRKLGSILALVPASARQVMPLWVNR